MLVASVLVAVGAIVVVEVSAETVAMLRQASFYAGGVANVATLGAFVFAASKVLGQVGRLGKRSRVFGYVAGVLAMLSVFSIFFYYANAFLPIGRVLSMVWTVVAAVVMFRRTCVARSPALGIARK